MKAIILALVVLLSGVIGAAGVWGYCERSGCGPQSASASQPAAATETVAASPSQIATNIARTTPIITKRACATVSPTATPTPPAAVSDGDITGLAIIGDSTADEYRADNPRGEEFGETTFNWVELLVRGRAIDVGAWGTRDEPRRGGYEYNWARSGATSQTVINDGQHTGVAQQIADGQVSHVIIQIGINDFYFNDYALAILNGELTGDELTVFLDGVIANIDRAVETVASAGDVTIVLAATQDYLTPSLLPEMAEIATDPAGRQRVVDAFAYVNRGLEELARRHEVSFFDFNAALQQELARRYDAADSRYLLVGGERIDLGTKGNEPHHAFLDDAYAHPGTVLSALMANLFIGALNTAGDMSIEPFTDDEILRLAGIR